jgi:nitrogen regulatory protein PII
MVEPVRMKRVTIIGDDTVRYRILKEIHELGATGYTDFTVHGEGARGVRPRHAEPANAKIEVIATPEVARRILEHIVQHYFDEYAMIAFLDDVEVLRGEKFGAEPGTQR